MKYFMGMEKELKLAYKVDMGNEQNIPDMVFFSNDIDLVNMTVTNGDSIINFSNGDYLVYGNSDDMFYTIPCEVFENMYKHVTI